MDNSEPKPLNESSAPLAGSTILPTASDTPSGPEAPASVPAPLMPNTTTQANPVVPASSIAGMPQAQAETDLRQNYQTTTVPSEKTSMNGAEKTIRILELLSGLAATVIVVISILIGGLTGALSLILGLPFLALAISNFLLFSSISKRSPSREKFAIAVIVTGLIATIVGAGALYMIASIGVAFQSYGNNQLDIASYASIYGPATLIALLGIVGSIWPYIYFRNHRDTN